MEKSNLSSLKQKSSGVHSGVAFIGSLDCNFSLIVKLPIYDYTVIKRFLEPYDIPCRWFSGSVTLSDLSLPQYHGTFILNLPNGNKRKFRSSFIYPLNFNNNEPLSVEECIFVQKLIDCLNSNKCSYYDKKDRSISAIFSLFVKSSDISSFTDLSAFGFSVLRVSREENAEDL